MKNRITALLLTVVALLAGCSDDEKETVTGSGLRMEAEAVWPEKGDSLYPSWLYLAPGLETLYNQPQFGEDVIEITLDNPGKGTRIGLQMQDGELAYPSRFETVTGEEKRVRLRYPVIWNPEKLLKQKIEASVELSWAVTINGTNAGTYNKQFLVRPVNECITGITTAASRQPAKAMYAGYIEEDHPELGALVREAVGLGIVPMFADYQRGTGYVRQQLLALWSALENRGVKTRPAGQTAEYKTETIHTLSQVLDDKGGSPTEVALLLTSLCQRLGFCTTLHTRPDGIYIGIADNFYSLHPALVYFIDVTRMNVTPGESRARFDEALQSGRQMYEQDQQARTETPAGYEEIWIDPVRLHVPSLSLSQY